MGFISSTFDKSVFNADSYKYAISENNNKGYAVLRVTPSQRVKKGNPDIGIIGIIQNPLSFSIEANWEEMGGITGMLPDKVFGLNPDAVGNFINKGVNIAGFANLGSVYASRKIYKKSGYLNIGADLKIVNWNNDGAPVKSALILAYLMLPEDDWGKEVLEKAKEMEEKLGTKAEEALSGMKNVLDKTIQDIRVGTGYWSSESTEGPVNGGIQALDKIGDKISDLGQKVQTGLSKAYKMAEESGMTDAIARSLVDNLEDHVLLRSSPTPVRLEVGNYFDQEDMIITNVNYEFSKEMTRTGPLYVDIKLTMSTRTILGDISDLGLYATDKEGSRIQYMGKNGNPNDPKFNIQRKYNTTSIG